MYQERNNKGMGHSAIIQLNSHSDNTHEHLGLDYDIRDWTNDGDWWI